MYAHVMSMVVIDWICVDGGLVGVMVVCERGSLVCVFG